MRYTKEEKLEIIRLVESSDLPLKRTVKELNVSTSTFYSWYNKFLEGGPDALEDKKCRSTWNKIPESYRTKVIEVALEDVLNLTPQYAQYQLFTRTLLAKSTR